jgi:hypothetical protein
MQKERRRQCVSEACQSEKCVKTGDSDRQGDLRETFGRDDLLCDQKWSHGAELGELIGEVSPVSEEEAGK